MLKGELVNEICREEPVCFRYSEGLVLINSRSSSACVEGRARQGEQLGSSSETVGARLPVLKGELVKVSSWARGIVRRDASCEDSSSWGNTRCEERRFMWRDAS